MRKDEEEGYIEWKEEKEEKYGEGNIGEGEGEKVGKMLGMD